MNETAETQHGVFSLDQARRAGFTRRRARGPVPTPLRAYGLPSPDFEHHVGDDTRLVGRADGAYVDLHILVELDSRRHHLSKLDFEADRERDNRCVAAGWRPLRFTWHHVTRRPDDVIEVLLRAGVVSHRPGDVSRRKLAE